MMNIMRRLSEERVFVVQGVVSLFLLLITIIICSFSNLVPEEEGIISAASCTSVVLFFVIISVIGKEGIEGFFYALVGSFIAWLALTLLGSRLAFDPEISNYLLASIALSITLSLSGILYAMPEKLNSKGDKISLKKILVWLLSTVFTVIVNFAIIYWVPKII
ncbi:MAG: hypothetical protein QXH51_05175 [Candidatus Bathyarchaeia archaeon]